MEDFRKDEIVYENDWQQFDIPQKVENENEKNNDDTALKKEERTKKPVRLFPTLITIQLVVCLIIAFLVFMLKAMNSQFYNELCDWYSDMMSETLVSTGIFEKVDLSEYFASTCDQMTSTSDEV